MQENEKKLFAELQSLRQEPENRDCADCHAKGSTMWASVNLGIFLCLTCGSHHRSLGTHISKPKGCTGTYWWGPDEIEQMKRIGNKRANEIYGSMIPDGLSNTDAIGWKQYLTDKYVIRKYSGSTTAAFSTRQEQDHVASPSPTRTKQLDLMHFGDNSPNAVKGSFFATFGNCTNDEPNLPSLLTLQNSSSPSKHTAIDLLDNRPMVSGNIEKKNSGMNAPSNTLTKAMGNAHQVYDKSLRLKKNSLQNPLFI